MFGFCLIFPDKTRAKYCCFLWRNKARVKEKTNIWMSVWWNTCLTRSIHTNQTMVTPTTPTTLPVVRSYRKDNYTIDLTGPEVTYWVGTESVLLGAFHFEVACKLIHSSYSNLKNPSVTWSISITVFSWYGVYVFRGSIFGARTCTIPSIRWFWQGVGFLLTTF